MLQPTLMERIAEFGSLLSHKAREGSQAAQCFKRRIILNTSRTYEGERDRGRGWESRIGDVVDFCT